jgi:hypothetical protein
MKRKFLFFFASVIFLSDFLFAQNVYKTNRGDNVECRKVSQTLWQGKTAFTKARQKVLIYEVERVQRLLDKLGYFGEKPDFGENFDPGYYDNATRLAVKQYQKENMPWVTANGAVGPKTLEFINKYEFCNSDRRFAQLVFDKSFSIPLSNFSFKYPNSEFKNSFNVTEDEQKRLSTFLDVCSVDDYANEEDARHTLCYKRNRDGELLGAALVSKIVADAKTKDACYVTDKEVRVSDINENTMLNGYKFYSYKRAYREVGHEMRSEVLRIWRAGVCHEFRLNVELARLGQVEDDEELLNKIDLAFGRMKASLETIVFTK